MAALGWMLGLVTALGLAFGAQRSRGSAARVMASLGLLLALGWTLTWGPVALSPDFPIPALVLQALGIGWLVGLAAGVPRAFVCRGREPVWVGLGLGLFLIAGGALLVGGVGYLFADPEGQLDGGYSRSLVLSLLPAVIFAALLDRRLPT